MSPVAKPAAKWTAGELMRRLEVRHGPKNGISEWALLPQVRSGRGFGGLRTADAIAIQLWASRGLEIHGYEIKVSRSDLAAELKDPSKADEVAQFCDRWWLVAPLDIAESVWVLPGAWGWLAPHGDGLKVAKQAEKLEPKPLDRHFVASAFKRAAEYVTPRERLDADLANITARAKRAAEERLGSEIERYRSKADRLERSVAAFEAQSGIKITEYDGEQLGELVSYARSDKAIHRRLATVRDSIARLHEDADRAVNGEEVRGW